MRISSCTISRASNKSNRCVRQNLHLRGKEKCFLFNEFPIEWHSRTLCKMETTHWNSLWLHRTVWWERFHSKMCSLSLSNSHEEKNSDNWQGSKIYCIPRTHHSRISNILESTNWTVWIIFLQCFNSSRVDMESKIKKNIYSPIWLAVAGRLTLS